MTGDPPTQVVGHRGDDPDHEFAHADRQQPSARTTKKDLVGLFITESERNSDFGVHYRQISWSCARDTIVFGIFSLIAIIDYIIVIHSLF